MRLKKWKEFKKKKSRFFFFKLFPFFKPHDGPFFFSRICTIFQPSIRGLLNDTRGRRFRLTPKRAFTIYGTKQVLPQMMSELFILSLYEGSKAKSHKWSAKKK
jgi:hypothetical protein